MKHLTMDAGARRRSGAFTLIELLVVVAIIGILAAIAITNMLYAQIRGRVGRAQADLKSLETVLETYHLDNEAYPRTDWPYTADTRQTGWETPKAREVGDWGAVWRVTTPITYIAAWPEDPFRKGKMTPLDGRYYDYYVWDKPRLPWGTYQPLSPNMYWMLWSRGPRDDPPWDGTWHMEYKLTSHYDPSNGLTSRGRIVRFSQ